MQMAPVAYVICVSDCKEYILPAHLHEGTGKSLLTCPIAWEKVAYLLPCAVPTSVNVA